MTLMSKAIGMLDNGKSCALVGCICEGVCVFKEMMMNLPVAVLFAESAQANVVFANNVAKDMFAKVRDGEICKLSDIIYLPEGVDSFETLLSQGAGVVRVYLNENMCSAGRNTQDGIGATLSWSAVDGGYIITLHLSDESGKITISNRAFAFDALTGLPNREVFLDRVNQAIRAAVRNEEKHMGLLFIDLDKFKPVNDMHGHDVGDAVLKEISSRIKGCLRTTDVVARHGGDEFVALLPKLRSKEDSQLVAERMLDACAKPIYINGLECRLGASIGIAMWPKDGINCAQLIKAADTAMYQGKHNGRNSIRFFDPLMNEQARNRANTESELRVALRERQFKLFYQPQFAISGELIGVEALIRWFHPQRGMVPPGQFIPVAEEANLISSIGEWAMQEAAEQGKRWLDKGIQIKIAVNISAKQFVEDLPDKIEAALERAGFTPRLFEVELTESFVLSDMDKAKTIINKLRALGVRVSIDDFGTGYSSLAYLQHIDFDTLKIDKSFVCGENGRFDARMISAFVAIARTLGLDTLAEGVETQESLERLKQLGCQSWQGFLKSGAVPEDQLEKIYLQHRGAALVEEA